ncbi:hypothetical protein PILCRDRAFT_813121 [Piloderma croceum F 1598]|uniref:Uncharacterized protein n=1 Tax=Piloderma croceum (strain F 1598) TaxID=765440 RepID=A0A0C3FYC0_PILCF|nr:hypothetical protein PILCRDRAFT_813121 [Piloderma croceum F 1598]
MGHSRNGLKAVAAAANLILISAVSGTLWRILARVGVQKARRKKPSTNPLLDSLHIILDSWIQQQMRLTQCPRVVSPIHGSHRITHQQQHFEDTYLPSTVPSFISLLLSPPGACGKAKISSNIDDAKDN